MSARPRLVIALGVASLLSVFLVYNALAGEGQLLVTVAQLRADKDGAATRAVTLTGKVVGPVRGAATPTSPKRFLLRDDSSPQTVLVSYVGAVPDAFRVGRNVLVKGRLRGGSFSAERDSLVAKCPSKYSSRKGSSS
jgi:cytochrome c-type biogenesis protein CcmE